MTTTKPRPATLPTLAEVREQRVCVNLDKLPVDPDGWCSWEVADGGWKHTPLCLHGVENGGPKLCEMWAARDARDAARKPSYTTRTESDIADREWNQGFHRPEWEITEAARKAAAKRAGEET